MVKEKIIVNSLEEFINIKDGGKDNCKSYIIKYNGNEFSAMVSGKSENVEHDIWDKTGGTSIYRWEGELKISIEKLKQKLDEETQGVKHCCCCGKSIYPKEKYEAYWAGIYCMKCWTPKLQEQRDYDYSHLD